MIKYFVAIDVEDRKNTEARIITPITQEVTVDNHSTSKRN